MPEQPDHNAIIDERRAKLKDLRRLGNPYPNDFRPKHRARELHNTYESMSKETLEEKGLEVSVAGRMMLKRVMGKASFAALQDGSGRIQIYLDSSLGEVYEAFKHYDLGDILGAVGTLFKTNKGELSVRVSTLRLLTKALRPLPEKFHGLQDQETKYRQRYVDLLTNEETREVFLTRSKMISALRQLLEKQGYLEVETPMMHPIPGGAAARPFVTYHHALDRQLYLRIAPELYLKRLIVGGLEKVFEINRSFRNEGLSTRHNPEFTMLEFYVAYQDYHYLMDFTEEMLRNLAQIITGGTVIAYQDKPIDFAQPFERFSMLEAMVRYNGYAAADLRRAEYLLEALSAANVAATPDESLASLQLKLFEETTEHLLFAPTFIIDYPTEVSPLARRNDSNPDLTERFELFIAGREVANGFSELNDPEDQASRFQAQAQEKLHGNEEAMHYDEDYIRALEYGMPPTAGEGIGIDRLVMLFTNSSSIRDVILFPQLRSE